MEGDDRVSALKLRTGSLTERVESIVGAAVGEQGKTLQRFQEKCIQSGAGFAILIGTLLFSHAAWAAATGDGSMVVPGAVVSGVVKDSQGVVQMGALVQVLAANSMTVATAFTDLHGHYAVTNLVPGRYEVRASAALFVPASKANLQLRTGAKAVVNLTLAALFDTASWLPASRRRADEPEDEWQWTLRSTANRPILRILDEDGVLVVSDTPELRGTRVVVRDAVTDGSRFGDSGVHDVLSVHRVYANGDESTLRADVGTGANPEGMGTSGGPFEVEAGLDRKNGYGGGSRTVIGFSSHPELVGPGGAAGVEVLELRSGQQMALGEHVDLEVGGEVEGVQSGGYAVAAHPFVRVTAHPGDGWRLQYRMATSRSTQEFADVKSEREEAPAAAEAGSKLALESGRHQEIALSRKSGRGVMEVAIYHDAIQRMAVAGGGSFGASSASGMQSDAALAFGGMVPAGFVVDPVNGSFRALAVGYTADGARISFATPVAHDLWIAAEYATGEALASETGPLVHVTDALDGLRARSGESAAVSLRGDLKGSGTRIWASYRWQPSAMVTAIDPYGALSDEAYLSCFVRQRVKLGSWIPAGLDATIDVSNLLAQGYRPFLSADGHTLYFAQAPRTIQAGLSFTF